MFDPNDLPLTPPKKPAVKPKGPPKPKKPKLSRFGWTLANHVCRVCFGRILSKVMPDGIEQFKCSNCGQVGEDKVTGICVCGAKFNTGKKIGLRCIPNPYKGPTSHSEIVAAER